jgi:hypothetical protein
MNGWPWLIIIAGSLGLLIALIRAAQSVSKRSSNVQPRRDGRQQLLISLEAVIAFLSSHQETHWARMLQETQTDLQEPATAARALSRLSSMFGGMGSLNDLVLTPTAVNAEFSRLLDALFRDLKLYNGTHQDLAEWQRLEDQYKDDPPPRVKHAFRKE